MTTPIEREAIAAANSGGAHAAPQPVYEVNEQGHPTGNIIQPPPPTIGRHAWIPKWFKTVLHATHAGVSHLAPVIMSPEVDQLIEAALRAEGLGVEAQVFHGAIDLIEGAASRRQQPAPADGNGGM